MVNPNNQNTSAAHTTIFFVISAFLSLIPLVSLEAQTAGAPATADPGTAQATTQPAASSTNPTASTPRSQAATSAVPATTTPRTVTPTSPRPTTSTTATTAAPALFTSAPSATPSDEGAGMATSSVPWSSGVPMILGSLAAIAALGLGGMFAWKMRGGVVGAARVLPAMRTTKSAVKKEEKGNVEECKEIKNRLDRKRQELGSSSSEFSLQQALVRELEKKVEEKKDELADTAQTTFKDGTRNVVFGLENVETITLRIHEAEDRIAASVRDTFANSTGVAVDARLAAEHGMKNSFDIVDTSITVFCKTKSDCNALVDHLAADEVQGLLSEIKSLALVRERGEVVSLPDKAQGAYDDAVAKYNRAKEIFESLKKGLDSLKQDIAQLESSYNVCMMGTPGLEGVLSVGKEIKLPKPARASRRVLVLAPPGSDKNKVISVLKDKGIALHDADALPDLSRADAPARWDKKFLEKFLKDKKDIYFFGVSENVFEMLPLFDKVYFLKNSEIHEKASRRGLAVIDARESPEEIIARLRKE